MITTDIETQNTSLSSGITPSTVVPAARNTGRKRDTAALITASKGVCPAAWSASISSIKTIAFLHHHSGQAHGSEKSDEAERLARDRKAEGHADHGKRNDKHDEELKSPTRINAMINAAGTTPGTNEACASRALLYSPSHSMV